MKEDAALSKREMRWPIVLWYIHLHALGIYGFWLLLFEAKWLTVIFAILITSIAALGITAGAHRLWAHRSYSASLPLRLFLMLAHTLTGVGSIFDWAVDHRIHHKYYRTEIDPYNHEKGFIYSHIFANLMTPHPDYKKASKEIDTYDLQSDGVVWIQNKFYWILIPIICLLLPINAPAEYWGESIMNSVMILGFLRLAITLQVSCLVNSSNLIWGLKPGNKYPPDDTAVFFISKSYWPHYHYVMPWDYKTSEFGKYDSGCTTAFIKIWHTLGLASGLKTSTSENIRDALGKVATGGCKIEESLRDVQKLAEEEVAKEELAFKH